MTRASTERSIYDLVPSESPFTLRYLSLRLKLDFTRRRLKKIQLTYMDYIISTTRSNRRRRHHHASTTTGYWMDFLEESFGSLKKDLQFIERNHAELKRRGHPRIKERLQLYESFGVFLQGYYCEQADGCAVALLNRDEETTTSIKRLIADFAGVPTGRELFDFRMLSNIFDSEKSADDSSEQESRCPPSEVAAREEYESRE